jgi:hypothetical protein
MWIQHLHTEKFTEHRKRTNKMEGERGRGSGRRVRGDIERERVRGSEDLCQKGKYVPIFELGVLNSSSEVRLKGKILKRPLSLAVLGVLGSTQVLV